MTSKIESFFTVPQKAIKASESEPFEYIYYGWSLTRYAQSRDFTKMHTHPPSFQIVNINNEAHFKFLMWLEIIKQSCWFAETLSQKCQTKLENCKYQIVDILCEVIYVSKILKKQFLNFKSPLKNYFFFFVVPFWM